MTDMRRVVAALAHAAPEAPFRLRQGQITACAANGTCTVTIGGDTTAVSGVVVASHVCPVPGAGCWIASDGRDLLVMALQPPDGPAYASARKTTAQAIPTAAWTALDWTSRSASSRGVTLGNDGFTTVVPGLYQVEAAIDFVSNATGQRHCAIYVNGAAAWQGVGGDAAAGGDVTRLAASAILELTVGDLVNVYLYQSSGANLNTSAASSYNLMRMAWLGPKP